MSGMSLSLGAVLATALIGADVSPLNNAAPRASTLIVSVGDNTTGAFIADAQVRLPSAGRVARTQWNGEVRFPGLASGKYRIQVRAIGYAPSDIDMPINGDSAGIYFALESVPRTLETVRVTENRGERGMAEFDERRRYGIGRFITDSMLQDDRTHSLRLLMLTRIPGLSTVKDAFVVQQPTKNGPCPVRLYLDGFEVKELGPLGIESIRLDDLSGIEAYDRETAPVQYRSVGEYCKVILMWSRW